MSIYETQPDRTINTAINAGNDVLMKDDIIGAVNDIKNTVESNVGSNEVFNKCKITISLWK